MSRRSAARRPRPPSGWTRWQPSRRRAARLRPSRHYSRSVRLYSVRVSVPIDLDLPRRLRVAPPRQRQRRRRVLALPLVASRVPTKRVRVTLVAPDYRRRLQPSVVAITPTGLRIYGRQRVRRIMRREMNRRRNDERKSRNRRRPEFGQLESLRSDPFGIVAAAVRNGSSARAVANAATVSRALGG